jgi:hypothetical protein
MYIRLALAVAIFWAVQIETVSADGCKGEKDSQYCIGGKVREVCTQNGYVVWADTRMSISVGEINYLSIYSPVISEPPCICIDLHRECASGGRTDCEEMQFECNRSIGSGGAVLLAQSMERHDLLQVTAFPQIRIINPARRAWRILARALSDEVAHVRHRHVSAEPRDQRFLVILTATGTEIAGEPHHAVRPFGERWRARDHNGL